MNYSILVFYYEEIFHVKNYFLKLESQYFLLHFLKKLNLFIKSIFLQIYQVVHLLLAYRFGCF